MITTKDENLYKRLLALRTHGITRNPEGFINSADFASGYAPNTGYPLWYMEMQELGYNYRLTDFQAALGVSQLMRADEGLAKRREIARRYDEAFAELEGLTVKRLALDKGHAHHLYIIEVDNRVELYQHLRANGIFAQIHYIPCHLMPYYRGLGCKEGDMPCAEGYYKRCISLPMYHSMTDTEILHVINIAKSHLDD